MEHAYAKNLCTYEVDNEGFYGEFGGVFVPDELLPNINELKENYLTIINSKAFQVEYTELLNDYVGRPSPLYYSKKLSQKYGANVYLKREDLNHTGAHKINNALGQALLAKKLGKTRLIAETGAGQHGVATATAAALLEMECVVYMGKVDIERQAPNVAKMKMLGTTVREVTEGGGKLKDAVDMALVDWIENRENTHYLIGSAVGPHPFPNMVALFQQIISKEIKEQLYKKIGRSCPDYVIACIGGGSNAAGAFYNFLNDEQVQLVAVEAAGKGVSTKENAATIHNGEIDVLHGSKSFVLKDENGEVDASHSISAGLDYPGIGPIHAHLHKTGRATVLAATDQEALDAAFELMRLEGILPALESSHALAALKKIKFKASDIVVVNISGRGDKDLDTYMQAF